MPVVTRFAPSPTGFLHLGSARTALYAWLHAKQHQGRFILRIEDTDLERSTQEAVSAILEGMEWLGLTWDEGPYYQTKRFDHYRAAVDRLIETGHAYRCTCTKERLEQLRLRQQEQKEKPKYDGHCRHAQLSQEITEPFVVRFKNPLEGAVVVEDAVHGRVVFQNSELDDLIIARSDGVPTYNLCVVVDDWEMGVTHVIRGDDHLNNTPKQINILKALNAKVPVYAHIPMILGQDGKRLSKRHGAVSVQQFREEGILPQALINYLVRLGWSHGDQEIFSMSELLAHFSIEGLNRAASAFNPEKLLWLNQHYLKTLPVEEVAQDLAWYFEQLKIETSNGPLLTEIIPLQAARCKTLVEMAQKSAFFYQEPLIDEALVAKHVNKELIPALEALALALKTQNNWAAPSLHQCLEAVAGQFGLGLGKLAQPLRIAVTGGTVSPPMDLTLAVLGREKTLERMAHLLLDKGSI